MTSVDSQTLTEPPTEDRICPGCQKSVVYDGGVVVAFGCVLVIAIVFASVLSSLQPVVLPRRLLQVCQVWQQSYRRHELAASLRRVTCLCRLLLQL